MTKTKNIIIETFLKTLQQLSYQELTVDKLCRSCYISRASFYNYFSSKEDILLTEIEEIKSNLNIILLEDLQIGEAVLTKCLEYIISKKEILTIYLEVVPDSTEEIQNYIKETVLLSEINLTPDVLLAYSLSDEFAFELYTSQILCIFMTWVKNSFREEPSVVAQMILKAVLVNYEKDS